MRRTAVWKWAGPLLASVAIVGVAFAQSPSKSPSPTEPGWLGVYTQELTDDLRDALGVQANGVLVSQVVDGSPADRSGLRKGDIILTVNDRAVESSDAFTETIRARHAGDVVAIRVLRDGSRQTVSVKLGSRSEWSDSRDDDDDDGDDDGDDDEIRVVIPNHHEIRRMVRDLDNGKGFEFGFLGQGRLGVRIQDMNRDLGEYFKVPDGRGALVLDVVDGSAAEKAGFRSGDVIVRVGDDAVTDSDDLVRALREREGQVSIEILRKGTRLTLQAELAEPRATMWRGGPRAFAFDGDGPNIRVPESDEELEREIQSLRRELDQLRKELQELRRK